MYTRLSIHRASATLSAKLPSRPNLADVPDYVGDQRLSMDLVRTIEDYWAKRGSMVDVTLQHATSNGAGMLWTIRSNMVNGCPLRRV